MVTAYYKHGSAKNLNKLLRQPGYFQHDNIHTRLQLCIDYVTIMSFLHNSPIGVRVMCDTARISKTLSQYLITDDFRLVVNDLDNLPEVDRKAGKLITCTNFKETRRTVPPEQRWPYGARPFRPGLMPPYDEKIDVWKIPGVVTALLGNVKGSDRVRMALGEITKRCRADDPNQRPKAEEVRQKLVEMKTLVRELAPTGFMEP